MLSSRKAADEPCQAEHVYDGETLAGLADAFFWPLQFQSSYPSLRSAFEVFPFARCAEASTQVIEHMLQALRLNNTYVGKEAIIAIHDFGYPCTDVSDLSYLIACLFLKLQNSTNEKES